NAVNGSVVLNADNSVTFTPDPQFNGSATFDYTVTDGVHQATGHVTVAVAAVNDAPTAVDDDVTVATGTEAIIQTSTLLANDTDIENDTLTITQVISGTGGTVTLEADGIHFTPGLGFSGQGSFTYLVSDGHATDTGSVTVNVVAGPDATNDELNGT